MEEGEVYTCIENFYEKVKIRSDPPMAPEWVNSDVILYTKDKDYVVTSCICLTDDLGDPRDWIYPYHNDDWFGWNSIECLCCGNNSEKAEPRKEFMKHFIKKAKI